MTENKVGFTLIELLVVVLIIGILASVALPQYQKAVERSRMAEAMQRLGDYASAQQVYYMHNNGFASAYSTLNQGDIKVPEQTEVGNWNTSDSRWSIASASGSNLEKVTMSALRTGGIFKDCVLTLSVEANGKITKTCSGNADCCTAAKNGGYEEGQSPSEQTPSASLISFSGSQTWSGSSWEGAYSIFKQSGSDPGTGTWEWGTGTYFNNNGEENYIGPGWRYYVDDELFGAIAYDWYAPDGGSPVDLDVGPTGTWSYGTSYWNGTWKFGSGSGSGSGNGHYWTWASPDGHDHG